MTAVLERTDYKTMTTEEISALKANDVFSCLGKDVTVAESGEYLDDYYKRTARYNYGNQKGKFWDKVQDVVDILNVSDEWPFKPLTVNNGRLEDGHHRANAAILAGWDKPIPVTKDWFFD